MYVNERLRVKIYRSRTLRILKSMQNIKYDLRFFFFILLQSIFDLGLKKWTIQIRRVFENFFFFFQLILNIILYECGEITV